MSVTTPVIGPVSTRVAGPVTDPPGKGGKGGGSGGRSEFEISIAALEPIAWYRFRDGNFNNRIQDKVPGGNKHLVKQIAAATRSAVPTRTTHPGGALFPSVTYDNWGTQGTFYKRAAESLLSGAEEFTFVVSARVISNPSADHYIAGLGTENVNDSGDNLQMMLYNDASDGNKLMNGRTRGTGLGLLPCSTEVTELVSDGVNRLYITRFKKDTIFRLTTSKPGHEALTEESALNTLAMKAISRPLVVNARSTTGSGASVTGETVIDQIALFDTDIGATAEADLHSKWMDEVAGAGYYPSMMQFDGSTGRYSHTFTSSGSAVTCVLRFSRASFAGGGFERLAIVRGPSTWQRVSVLAFASDHADADRAGRIQFAVNDSANTSVCLLLADGYLDGEEHVCMFSFDGVAGTAQLIIDEIDADETGNADRVAPTTGTLDSGASSLIGVGANSSAADYFSGEIGFFGHADAYLTNYEDFMDGNLPKPIDEKDWTEFGSSQPLVFAHDGDLENNKGSAGDFTKNGTITRTVGGSP